jgi:hypothetical protein
MRKRGEGSIAPIGRGVYKVRIRTGVIGGKRGRHEEIVHGTHEDAVRVLAQHSIQRRPHAYGETAEHFLNRWLTDHVIKTKRGSTVNNHLRNVTKHIVPLIGRKQLMAVGPGDVETIMDHVTGKGLGSGSVHNVRATMGAAWDWGVKSQRIPGLVNVVRLPLIDRPKRIKSEIIFQAVGARGPAKLAVDWKEANPTPAGWWGYWVPEVDEGVACSLAAATLCGKRSMG